MDAQEWSALVKDPLDLFPIVPRHVYNIFRIAGYLRAVHLNHYIKVYGFQTARLSIQEWSKLGRFTALRIESS